MGRGGGSSGGHSSSHGGGSSRTHYSGSSGRSNHSSYSSHSSGRSSSSYSSHSSHSSPSSYYRPSYNNYGHNYNSGHYYSNRTTSYTSPIRLFTIFAFIIIMIVICMTIFNSIGINSSIRSSTMERIALNKSSYQQIDKWYKDRETDKWIYNETELINGMKYFYNKTGVQPYLIILSDINGNKRPTDTEITNYLKDVYDEVMPDGGHIVVCFLEGYENEYATGSYAGALAESVMDEEAREILNDYFEYYYTSDLDDEEYFSTVFKKTADKIMTVDEAKSVSRNKLITTLVLIMGIIMICSIILNIRKKKAEQAEADAKILNANLDEDIYKDPLKDKYGIE